MLSLASVIGSRGWRQDPSVLVLLQIAGTLFGIDTEQVPRASAYPLDSVERARAHAEGPLTELIVERRRVHLIEAAGLIARIEGRDAD